MLWPHNVCNIPAWKINKSLTARHKGSGERGKKQDWYGIALARNVLLITVYLYNNVYN